MDPENARLSALVVDDEPLNLRLLKTLLESLDLDVTTVESGTDAQRLMAEKTFDLLLFDVMMPEPDGLELTRWARQNSLHKEIPIFVLTSLEGKNVLMKAFDAGAVDFLTRPFHQGELVHRVRAQLKLRLLQKQMETLSDWAHRDTLTGLWNRRKAWELMEYEALRSAREGRTIGVAMLDIDKFKSINDSLGHDRGDLILKETAAILGKTLRKGDILARWGGEEFLAVFPETDREGSRSAAEKLRAAIVRGPWDLPRQLTVSIGVSVKVPDHDWEPTLKEADEALYRAKESGRNQVILY